MITNSDILNAYGGVEQNSLKHVMTEIDETNIDNNEPELLEITRYMNNDSLVNIFSSNKSSVSVLSLNCQSIFAKYDELIILINTLREKDSMFKRLCL
jgi:hypothetical protein